MLDTLICTGAQIIEASEDNRFGWTNLRASRCEAALLSIVTEGAFECAARVRQRRRSPINHPKRTRHDAVAAAIANVVLHQDRTNLGPHNRPGRTRFQTASFFAMLANIRQEYPAKRIFRLRRG